MSEDITVFCTKEHCQFEMDWYGCESRDYALNYYRRWNEDHHDYMQCVHNYSIRHLTKGGKLGA